MTWVVVNDPVPSGASMLGTGLGRDEQINRSGERQDAVGRHVPAGEPAEHEHDQCRQHSQFPCPGRET